VRRLACAVTLVLILDAWGSPPQGTVDFALRGRPQQLHLYGPSGGNPIILSSGDLGWAGLVVHVADFLAARGYFIIGFNSRAYLASFTTKDSTLGPRRVSPFG
jgi:hypothetical protein